MNKFKYYFVLLLAGIAIVSCSKKDDDDQVVVTPPRDYAVQYKADNDSIEKFLKTNYIEDVTADFDVKISKIPTGGTQVSIWDQKTYELLTRDVYSDGITYKVYYLVLRGGSGQSPTNTDKVSVSYSCYLLNGTQADTSNGQPFTANLFPYANTETVIEGWSEIFPKFKTGSSSSISNDGVITYNDYGAGVMFLPSGLAYYAQTQGSIPAYSPLYFTFKLFDLQRMDNEYNVTSNGRSFVGDGVPDYLEDVNGDGYLYDFRNTAKYPKAPEELIDDTDGDGIADFVDFDDDGDGYTTRLEITKPTNEVGWGKLDNQPFYFGISKYYPFDPVSDNPRTPNIDETEPRGIPAFSASGTPDYTTPDRKRIHLDKDHHTAK